MKVLVTGANGYLGRGVVKAILDRGHEVVATDVNIEIVDSRATKVCCDIFELDEPYRFFGEPDILLHLAWRDGFVHYSDAHIDDLPKHYHFIKTMCEQGVGQIAVMGSMHEVGFFEGSVNESTPCNPVTPYGIGKNALRNLTQTLCKQKNIVFQWLRGYYIVGNTMYGSSIFSKIVEKAKCGDKEFPFTLGLNQYDFVDYEEFCEQVSAAITQTCETGIINICSGRPEKLADRVERFIKDNNFDISLKYGVFPDRPYDSKAIWGDNTKIQRIMLALEEINV